MSDVESGPSIVKQDTSGPKGSAWRIYSRLLGYAWRYKGRLLVSLFFSLVVAASFGTMLISLGTVINLTLYDPSKAALSTIPVTGGAAPHDPADDLAAKITQYSAGMKRALGWAPEALDQRFLALVAEMRQQKIRALTVVCALVLVMAFVISLARFLQSYWAGSVAAGITTDIECEMYENVVRQSMGFFESNASGKILARFTNDVFMVSRGISEVFVTLMREPIKALALVAVALSVDVWLTLMGMCVLPPLLYALVLIGKSMRRSTLRSLERVASIASVINETVKGILIIKGYNMEAYEVGRVRKGVVRLRRYLLRLARLDAATHPATEFLLVVGVVIFTLLSGQRVVRGQLELGDLLQLYLALGFMLDPVRKLSAVNNAIQRSVASAERVFEYIDMKPSIVERPNAIAAPPLRESLRFENVHFSYNGVTEVLKGIDIEIRKGEMVAVVGPSGAGKSTLAKLIPRFYEVTAGFIRIDGVDIRDVTFQSLRDQIGIVTQDTILFAESIRENIAFGRTTYSDERVRDAARAAHATEFVEKLPQGFDTVVGESGATLSGGQRQRIAIARAIIKDPAILILDEATSSLDSESERLIQEALDRFIAGRTTVVIAHRLSTVQRADRILVISDGRIVEQGTHSELLAQGGAYKRLYETQFGWQEDEK